MNMPIALSQENKYFANFINILKQIEDPRDQKKIKYPIYLIAFLLLCGMLAGANNFVEIADFCKARKRMLNKHFGINLIPSHDTFNRVIGLILPKEFNYWILKALMYLVFKDSKIINFDGKVIEAYSSDDPFTIVRAWSTENKIVLGQVRVPFGTNEITTIPLVLDLIDVKDKTITIDAIGSQTEIVNKIVENQGDYFIALKSNQGTLYKDVSLYFDSIINDKFSGISYDYAETFNKDHGRYEIRRCWTTNDIKWLEQYSSWKKLSSITVIEAIIEKKGKTSINKRYFINSLQPNAELHLDVARSHWSIENQLHWHLDVNFNEDRSTIKGYFCAQNMSLLRSVAISILSKFLPEIGFQRKRQIVNRKPSTLKKIFLK